MMNTNENPFMTQQVDQAASEGYCFYLNTLAKYYGRPWSAQVDLWVTSLRDESCEKLSRSWPATKRLASLGDVANVRIQMVLTVREVGRFFAYSTLVLTQGTLDPRDRAVQEEAWQAILHDYAAMATELLVDLRNGDITSDIEEDDRQFKRRKEVLSLFIEGRKHEMEWERHRMQMQKEWINATSPQQQQLPAPVLQPHQGKRGRVFSPFILLALIILFLLVVFGSAVVLGIGLLGN